MSRYLITGGAGFIGSHIVRHLIERGETVRVLDNFSTGRRENIGSFLEQIELIEGDVRIAEDCAAATRGVDFVLHQAALPSVPRSIADPISSHDVNVLGTLNLLIAARDARVKRFVYASSSSVYGDQGSGRRSEDMRTCPLSPYAVSKLAGEHYVRAFSTCYGLEAISLRYFNVFGPHQDPNSPYSAVIPLFVSALMLHKNPVVFGDGTQRRDFTFVENNVAANLLAATAPIAAKGQVYNIACGNSLSLNELIAAANKIMETAIEPDHQPARVGDVYESCADISRARAELGYQPIISFDEGLRRTVDWYTSNKSR